MSLLTTIRHLQNRTREWSTRGRLVLIPVVLVGLVPYVLAVLLRFFGAGSGPWSASLDVPKVLITLTLGLGAPIGLAMVWRWSRPNRRVLWVYDWLGSGILCVSAAWMMMGLQESVNAVLVHPTGRLLLSLGMGVWGSVGLGLLVTGTALLAAELRSERREREQLEALIEFTSRITSLDYAKTLDETVRHLFRLLEADACVLFLWNETEQVLVPVAHHHDPKAYTDDYIVKMMSFKTPMGFGLTGWVMQTGQPYLTGDVANDPHSQSVPGYRVGQKSCLVAPIQVEGRRLGVVRLTRKGLHQFTRVDLDLAISFAGQAALVIEHGRMMKELSDLSITDALTGLHNARHFHQVFEMELHRAKRYSYPLALTMIDSDSLKTVNDRLGHQKGDEHLRMIGRALRSAVRVTDYAFRYAGDEFLILLPNTAADEAAVGAERVRRTVEAEELAAGLRGTVSIGVASFPHHADDAKNLLSAADAAMYVSKRSGKNRVSMAASVLGNPRAKGD